jgi:hypothetical protein
MAVNCMSWVFEHSEAKLGARLVLLVLADHAKKDGTASWPALDTIARETRMSKRAVQDALKKLEAEGHIEQTGVSRAGTRIFSVLMRVADSAMAVDDGQGGSSRHPEGAETATEPSKQQPSKEPSEERAREHEDFAAWLTHHSSVTASSEPKGKARKTAASMFSSRRDEGYSLEDLQRATLGAFNDEFRREHGYFDHISVLRPTKVAALIEKGKRGKVTIDPMSGREMTQAENDEWAAAVERKIARDAAAREAARA